MSYEHKSNVKPKRVPAAFKIISAIIIILLIFHFFFPNFLPNFFTKVISPFWAIGKPAVPEFSKEYEDTIIMELRRENAELKKVLNRVASSTATLAYVLKKPPFTAYDSFVIDVGKTNGIVVGEKVYAHGNILLGEVVEVNDLTSKVKLYSTYGEKYEVLLGTGTTTEGAQVTATGRGGGSFEILIPRDLKVKIGDPVTVPDLQVGVFGIVKDIVGDQSKTFSTVLFSQPINIYEIRWVELYQQ